MSLPPPPISEFINILENAEPDYVAHIERIYGAPYFEIRKFVLNLTTKLKL